MTCSMLGVLCGGTFYAGKISGSRGGMGRGCGSGGRAGADGLQTSVRGCGQMLRVFSCRRRVAGMAQGA